MNTFMELAEKRFSVRQFTDQPIAEDVLAAILEAGRIAPTAKNTQPQRVFVLKSAEALELARKITPCTFSAPVVLLVAYDRTEAFRYPGEEELDSGAEDCAIVVAYKGDVDLSGALNAKDATFIKQVYLKLATLNKDAALQTLLCDVSGDGRFNAKDATAAKQAYLKLITLEW